MENFNSFTNSTAVFEYGESGKVFDSDAVLVGNQSEFNCTNHEGTTDDVKFVFQGVGITFVALFGIPANVLSVIVLKHPKMKSSLTTLLLGQAISDMFVITMCCLLLSFPAIFKYLKIFSWYNAMLHPIWLPYLVPMTHIAQMSSVYFTVVVTLERYIAVCLPLKARYVCTQTTARNAALAVIILSILYNMPRWFEYQTVELRSNCTGTIRYTYEKTQMKLNDDYRLYYTQLSYLLVFFFIPFSILLFFNITIYFEVKKQRCCRRNSLSPTMVNATSSHNSEDVALAGMLFGIVITFFACNMLFLLKNVMQVIFRVVELGSLTPISNFLIIFGCSTNFVFYCMFGNKFRSQLARTLGRSKVAMKESKDFSSDNNNFQMNSNARNVISINSPPRNQCSYKKEVTDTNPNAVEDHMDEISCSQVTVATYLGD